MTLFRILTALLLLLPLALPAGAAGAAAGNQRQAEICSAVVEAAGMACCAGRKDACCCRAEAPIPSFPERQPAAPARGPGHAWPHELLAAAAAALPALPVLEILPRLDVVSLTAGVPASGPPPAELLYRDPVKLCVLCCRLAL